MSELEKITYKNTLIKLAGYAVGLIITVATLSWRFTVGVNEIKNAIIMHEYRISTIESDVKDIKRTIYEHK